MAFTHPSYLLPQPLLSTQHSVLSTSFLPQLLLREIVRRRRMASEFPPSIVVLPPHSGKPLAQQQPIAAVQLRRFPWSFVVARGNASPLHPSLAAAQLLRIAAHCQFTQAHNIKV